MSNFLDIQNWASAEYTSLFPKLSWVGCPPEMAKLVVEDSPADSGYSFSEDTIWVRVEGWDVLEGEVTDLRPWPTWKAHLVHEMLHEYQHKAQPTPSPQGEALYAANQRSASVPVPGHGFVGAGHDAMFYESVVIHAAMFGMTPTRFVDVL